MLPVKLTYDAKNENCSGSKSPGSVRLWHFYDIGSRYKDEFDHPSAFYGRWYGQERSDCGATSRRAST